MFKSICLTITLASSILFFSGVVSARTSEKTKPFEEFYPESGYKSLESAAADFENHFKQPLKLPLRVPPISFTHYFGRLQLANDGMNDCFIVDALNDKVPGNHYKIVIRPITQKVDFNNRTILGTYQLKNGKTATLIELGRFKHANRKSSSYGFNVLLFERENWQYELIIDRRKADIVTSKVLVTIANSIDYPSKQSID